MPPRRDVKVARWILVFALLVMAGKAILNWMEEPVVSVNYVDKLNQLRRPADSNDSGNGAVAFLKACKVMEGHRITGDKYLEFQNANGERWFGLLRPLWPGDMNDIDKNNLGAWLADNDQAFRMAEYAMSKEYCVFDIHARGGSMDEIRLHADLIGVRVLAEAFLWRAKMKAADGDAGGAIRDVLLVSSMSRHFVNYPVSSECWLGVQLVEKSCWTSLEIAAGARLRSDQLAQLVGRLEANARPYYVLGTALEHLSFSLYDQVQRFYSDDGHGNGRFLAGHAYRYQTATTLHLRRSTPHDLGVLVDIVGWSYTAESRRTTLDRWDKAVEKTEALSDVPLWELRSNRAADVKSLETDLAGNLITESYARSLQRYVYMPQKTRNIVEGALTALALLQYKADKGTLPTALDELVGAGYLGEMPLDRFSGKAYVYERIGDDFTLYSIGEDRAEDGRPGAGRITFWPATGCYRGRPINPPDEYEIYAFNRMYSDDPNLRMPEPAPDPNE